MDYVRNLRLGNSLFSQWVSDLQNSEQAPYVGKLGSSGVWAEEEHRTFQAQPVSEMLYFIRAEVMQTWEVMSSFPLEECSHVQISFNELGTDDSGFGHRTHFLHHHSRTYS